MLFYTHTEDLKAALALALTAVPSRPSHPVLGCFKLTVAGSTLTITSFDLSIGIESTVEVDVHQIGECCVPAGLFSSIVSKLQNNLKIELNEGGNDLSITTEDGEYSIHTMSPDEFPAINEPEGSSIVLPAFVVESAFNSTLFSVSSDETKQILTGVNIKGTGTEVKFGATDGHRLAKYEAPDISDTFLMTLPLKAANIINKLCSSSEEIGLKINSNLSQFRVADTKVTTRLLEGDYPQYDSLLPDTFSTNFTVDRREFFFALSRIAVISNHGTNIVRMVITEDTLELLTASTDVGDAMEKLPIQLMGNPMQIAFKLVYLVESLRHLETTEVQVSLNSNTSPVIITPLGGSNNVKHLIMPVQIRD
jgi:DNA polymerase-3 subunit beta